MSRSAGFRIAVLLLLLIPLASPARAANHAGKAPSRHQDRSLVAWIQDAVAEIQKTILPDATGKGDSRGTMDPDGLTSTPSQGDSGGTMNPDGRS
ncbi:MAG: hypothetical protein JF614_05475 [Acidobacteria bacterium]|nr:hypothetical protein [Acidobacteriota bacterium]